MRFSIPVLAAACAALMVPSAVSAGTFDVIGCADGNGTGTHHGWTTDISGAFAYTSAGCAAGQGLSVSLDNTQVIASNARAWWTFAVPSGAQAESLSIEEVHGNHRVALGPSDGGHPTFAWTRDRTDGNYNGAQEFFSCTSFQGCRSVDGGLAWGPPSLNNTRAVRFWVICGGSQSCVPHPGQNQAYAAVRDIRVRIKDPNAPAVGSVDGSARADTTWHGSKSLSASATDSGGGLHSLRLSVDGQTVASGSYSGCRPPYRAPVPCPGSGSAELIYNPAQVPDGQHVIRAYVVDVAENASLAMGPRTVVFDNHPPAQTREGTIDAPEAQVGVELTATPAAFNGQNHTTTLQWRRCNADGTGCTDIPAATASTYTPTAQDEGKKLLLRTIATDAGGTATHTTAITAGPFADGRTVKPAAPVTAQGDPGQTPGVAAGTGSPAAAPAGAPVNPGASTSPGAVKLTVAGPSTRTVRFNRSATLSTRLRTAQGTPIAGATIYLLARSATSTSTSDQQVAAGRTDANGRARITSPKGANRILTAAYKPQPTDTAWAAKTEIKLYVRAASSLRLSRTRMRNGQLLRLSGRVQSRPLPRSGVLVQVQARRKGTKGWKAVAPARRTAGTWKLSYRFRSTTRTRTYEFRARVLRDSTYSYVTGSSNTRQVRVRG
ncbi:hypothetical protein GKE82_24245 [Conexibacter sp. W3-3-2]|uniref:hypothetical protein n=1 Tax=Conexibacter sp. W3-3-2 TaxID=2675227 RepID=UPI0012B8F91E|nr:hypothetical protein [Conexibacter sp. W3-3-2]MTD47320.1 hypothetical protein [Conexibacter sp. W3-3-2]